MKIRVLSKDNIKAVVDMSKVIEGVEQVYRTKSKGGTEVWPTIFHDFETGKADMDIKSGYLKELNLFGHKTASWFLANEEKGLPQLVGIIAVFDGTTGCPLGILDAGYITGLRTGAAGSIGAKYLSNPDSENLLVVGAGAQALFQIAGALTLMKNIKTVSVYDMDEEKAERFVDNLPFAMTDDFKIQCDNVCFAAVENIEDAVKKSDIIVTVTPTRTPIIKKEWVKPGTHFSCIGADMTGKEEIQGEIFEGARIYTDDKSHSMEVGEMEIPLKEGIISEENIVGEIGDLLEGKVKGRLSKDDITIFDATGMALLDIATAKTALDLAEKEGEGTVVEL